MIHINYDVFLAGPWEKYSTLPWKKEIKKEFSDKNIYDPEDHQDNSWFQNNIEAIYHSKNMLSYVPEFPFPGVALESGIFWEKEKNNIYAPSKNLIFLWQDTIQPDWGKEVAKKMGSVVSTLDEAVAYLHRQFSDPDNNDFEQSIASSSLAQLFSSFNKDDFDAYQYKDINPGEYFIILPVPGDNAGHGGFKGAHHVFKKINQQESQRYVLDSMCEKVLATSHTTPFYSHINVVKID